MALVGFFIVLGLYAGWWSALALLYSLWRKQWWLCVLLLLAMVLGVWRQQEVTQHWRPQLRVIGQQRRSVSLQGEIDSVVQPLAHGSRFIVSADHINGKAVKLRVRLSWYGWHPQLQPGQRWQWRIKLTPNVKLPEALQGYAYWLRQHDIVATGYVQTHQAYKQLAASHKVSPILRWRWQVLQQIQAHVASQPNAAMVAALSIGSRALLQEQNWQVLQATGTNHLVAIAGLHLGFVAALVVLLLRGLGFIYPKIFLRVPLPRLQALFALFAVLLYASISGFALPAQRASIMWLLLLLGSLLRWRSSFSLRVCLAMVLVLFLDPLAYQSASFWLSFLAVTVIGISLPQLGVQQRWWRHFAWHIQWRLSVLLLPVGVYFFQQASVVSLLANLLAIPWVACVLLPLCVIADAVSLVSWHAVLPLWQLAAKASGVLWWWLGHLSLLPAASWHWHAVSLWGLVAAQVGMLLLMLPRELGLRPFFVCFLLISLAIAIGA